MMTNHSLMKPLSRHKQEHSEVPTFYYGFRVWNLSNVNFEKLLSEMTMLEKLLAILKLQKKIIKVLIESLSLMLKNMALYLITRTKN